MDNGKLISERDMVEREGPKPIDWALDIVSTGDIYKIRELHLICPPSKYAPTGQTARLPITIPGTAFQFKISNIDTIQAWKKSLVGQVIGRVDDPRTGECTVMAWDNEVRCLVAPYTTNIFHFKAWKDSVAPISHLSLPIQGMDRHFGNRN